MTPPTAVRATPLVGSPFAARMGISETGLAVRGLAAAAAGGLAFLAFPPVGAWYAAPFAVAGLTLAVRGRGLRAGFLLGTIFGAALFLPLLTWVTGVGADVWLILAIAEALFVGLLGAATARAQFLPGWPLWVACLWVADEAVRSRVPLGGFPWGRLAFSQAAGPLAPYAAIGGAPLVSFAVALAGALLAAAAVTVVARRSGPVRVGRGRLARWRPAMFVVGVGVVAGAGYAVPLPTAGQAAGGPAYVTVAVVQGNVPRLGLDAFAQRYAVIDNHVRATEAFATDIEAGRMAKPDVMLWPENSTDIDPASDPVVATAIGNAVRSVGVPTLVGAVIDGPGRNHVRNAGLVWNPGQRPSIGYVKRHLVPFGEYVPYRTELGSLIGRLRRVPYDFVAGHRSGVVQLGPVRLSDVICYEVAYDGLVRGDVRGGGRLIVVQTNNATFGRNETEQQLAMGRLRAIEHGRSVAVAATSGISALIAPDGRLLDRSRVFTQDVLEQRVPLRSSLTIADRLGGWLPLGIAIAGALAAAVALLPTGRRQVRRNW